MSRPGLDSELHNSMSFSLKTYMLPLLCKISFEVLEENVDAVDVDQEPNDKNLENCLFHHQTAILQTCALP